MPLFTETWKGRLCASLLQMVYNLPLLLRFSMHRSNHLRCRVPLFTETWKDRLCVRLLQKVNNLPLRLLLNTIAAFTVD